MSKGVKNMYLGEDVLMLVEGFFGSRIKKSAVNIIAEIMNRWIFIKSDDRNSVS